MQINFLCSYLLRVSILVEGTVYIYIYVYVQYVYTHTHTQTHILMMSVHLCNAVVITPIRTYKLHPHC